MRQFRFKPLFSEEQSEKFGPDVCLLLLFSVMQSNGQTAPQVASVKVEPTDITAQIGQPLQFKAVGLDASGKPVDAPVTMWFAAPWDVGSADANGVVRPQAPGLLRVGAKVGDKIGYARVMVEQPAVTKLEMSATRLLMMAGQHVQVSAIPARRMEIRELTFQCSGSRRIHR